MRNSRIAARTVYASPLYYGVKSVLEERIRSGRLPPNCQLPSESDLCAEFDVSRGMVREALRELATAGLIDRHHGKGTFVSAKPPFSSPPMKFTGLLEDLYDQVTKIEVRSVSVDVAEAPPLVLCMLSLNPGTRLTIVRRNRYLDNEPFAYTINYLPTHVGERLNLATLRKYPLLWTLEQKLGNKIDSAEQNMRAILADAEIAEHLSVPFASPLMFAERIYFTRRDIPLHVAQSYYRADRYQFSVRLKRYYQEGQWRWDFQKPRT